MSAFNGGTPERPNSAIVPEPEVGSGDEITDSPSDATLSGSSILPPDDAVRERSVSKAASRTIDPSKLQPSDFYFGKCLGEGAYARVVHARAKNTESQFAIKIMEKRHIKKENKVRLYALFSLA
jgi:3-phosphoinositide dependent protein kinase-1